MATVIKIKNEICSYPKFEEQRDSLDFVKTFFPYRLRDAVENIFGHVCHVGERMEEIRIRSEKNVYVTVGGGAQKRNAILDCILTYEEVSQMLENMCDGSLYAYSESIVNGYVSLKGGIRVGVCGRASVEEGRIRGVYNVSSLNIRLPCRKVDVDKRLSEAVRSSVIRGEGVLIYSPPSQGKTTLLRSLAYDLSFGERAMRTSLIDTRDELGILNSHNLSLDVLSGYPKADGIRIATAFMNPQVIICDEIGSEDEAIAIAQAQNCGVPLIASAHGSSLCGIMRRNGIRLLHEVGAFGIYIGIRINFGMGFEYKIQPREEVEFENIGNLSAFA